MKKSFFNIFIFTILMFFTFVISGSAEVLSSTGVMKNNGYLYYNSGNISYGNSIQDTTSGYPSFHYKYADEGTYVCTTDLSTASPTGSTCQLSSLPDSDYEIGLGYIVNLITNVEGGTNTVEAEEYYWLELAALHYLGKYDPSNNFGNELIPNVNQTFEEVKNNAQAYQNKYEDGIVLSLSEDNLEFELNSDGYYYSQKVYITDENQNSDSINISVNNNKFTLIDQSDSSGRYFQLKVSKSEVTSTTLNVNVTVTGEHTYYKANFYNCDDQYQDVISTVTTSVSKNGSVSISGKVSTTELIIQKLNENGKFLAGAVIKVENEDKTYSQTFTTTDQEILIKDLKYGTYTITELSAPEGYVILKSPIVITLSDDNLVAIALLENNLNRVEISKISAVNNQFLAGAVLQIQDSEGNVVKDSNGNNYEWTSTEAVYVIEGLSKGTYYLVEKSAPEGYELNTEKVMFEVKEDETVIEVTMENNLEVEVPDTLSSRSTLLIAISMFDIALGIGIITYVKKNKIEE